MILSSFAEDSNSIGSIAKSVIANEVEKIEGKDVFRYSLKRSETVKPYQLKHLLNLTVKVKVLLFLTNCFKS